MRLFLRASCVCAALLWFAPSAPAQTLEEIIAKNLEAKGGEQKLRDTTSVRMTGTMTIQGMKGTTVALSKRPQSFRREMDLAGQKMIQGYDGTTVWMERSGMAAQEVPAGPQADAFKRNDFDSAFLDWQKKGHKIEYQGKLIDAGKEYYQLLFTPKDGPPIEYLLDPATGLEARTIMTVDGPGGKTRMETRYSDYRNIDGRMIPFVMTSFMNGAQVQQIRLDRIEFNVPLDDALFRMPK